MTPVEVGWVLFVVTAFVIITEEVLMSWVVNKFRNEPVILSTIATAIMALLVSYKISVTADQAAAIVGLTTVIGNFIARTVTTSTLTPDTTPDAVAKIVQTAAAVQSAVIVPAAPVPYGGVGLAVPAAPLTQGIPDQAVIGGTVESATPGVVETPAG